MAMFRRQSNNNLKLQEDLRDTMKTYGEEKSILRAQLANLRLDLTELHRDDRTVTTEETGSGTAGPSSSDWESKRMVDFDMDSSRSLQLPVIKNLSGPQKNAKNSRFNNNSWDTTDSHYENSGGGRSFLENSSWENKQESQKFLELQKNQDVLRNIGRANLKEKRQSLIRLATISSAKKRNSLWDSGNNVSRPKDKSTDLQVRSYLEDTILLNRRNFLIPKIKDPHRSEIVLNGPSKRPTINKRRVQFTRPREDNLNDDPSAREKTHLPGSNITNMTIMEDSGVNSLNTTMADVSLEDNTLGNITFDDDVFKRMMTKDPQNENSSDKGNTNNRMNGNLVNETLNSTKNKNVDTTNSTNGGETYRSTDTMGTTGDSGISQNSESEQIAIKCQSEDGDNNNKNNNNNISLPQVKTSQLAKKNLQLHNDLNNMRVPPYNLANVPVPKLSLSPENKSCKDSDRSVGTKLSQLSHQTEMRKDMYTNDVDPKRRNQTLSDIMFAVRSRMRENEETLRFGQTPRPRDYGSEEHVLPRYMGRGSSIKGGGSSIYNGSSISSLTPRWNNASPRKGKVSTFTAMGTIVKLFFLV